MAFREVTHEPTIVMRSKLVWTRNRGTTNGMTLVQHAAQFPATRQWTSGAALLSVDQCLSSLVPWKSAIMYNAWLYKCTKIESIASQSMYSSWFELYRCTACPLMNLRTASATLNQFRCSNAEDDTSPLAAFYDAQAGSRSFRKVETVNVYM